MIRIPISSRRLQHLPRLLLIMLVCGASFPVAAQQPAGVAATAGLQRIEGVLLNALFGIGKVRLSNGMVPILYQVDGRRAVTITSNRLSIARSNAEAVEKGGRYTPPNDVLVDAVIVSCGSADRIDRIFNCKRLAVSTS